MRIAVGRILVQPDIVEQLPYLRCAVLLGADTVDGERLADHLADRVPGVEGAERVLKDDLQAPAQRFQRAQ